MTDISRIERALEQAFLLSEADRIVFRIVTRDGGLYPVTCAELARAIRGEVVTVGPGVVVDPNEYVDLVVEAAMRAVGVRTRREVHQQVALRQRIEELEAGSARESARLPGICVVRDDKAPGPAAAAWRTFRSMGYPIVSTWIDEATLEVPVTPRDRWLRNRDETRAAALVLVSWPNESLSADALVEVGMALGRGGRVFIAGPHAHLGSWVWTPGITLCADMVDAAHAAKAYVDTLKPE